MVPHGRHPHVLVQRPSRFVSVRSQVRTSDAHLSGSGIEPSKKHHHGQGTPFEPNHGRQQQQSILNEDEPLFRLFGTPQNSTSGHFGQLRETLEANPNFILTTYEQMMRLLLSGCCSFAVVGSHKVPCGYQLEISRLNLIQLNRSQPKFDPT